MPSPLHVCHVAANLNRDVGGPAVSVTRLAGELAALGSDQQLFTLDYAELGPIAAPAGCRLHAFQPGRLARPGRGFSPGAAAALNRVVAGGVEIVHNHGLWMFPNAYARRTAQRAGVPLIIAPRGMLEAWALRQGRLKKWIAWRCFEQANLRAARAFHATSDAEVASVRAAGFRQPVALVPNGVDVPDPATIPARGWLEEKFPELRGRRWLVFLSRIHPKKGVAELLQAFGAVREKFPDWHLILAGSDTTGYSATVRRMISELGLERRVTLTGMLTGADRACALGNADVFVLPTHSENFGIAIADALAHGVPVITTKAAPWDGIVSHDCGWWIDVGVAPLAASLESALCLPSSVLRDMGRRGRDFVAAEFSWPSAARQMLVAYLWLLGRAPQPPCIQST